MAAMKQSRMFLGFSEAEGSDLGGLLVVCGFLGQGLGLDWG